MSSGILKLLKYLFWVVTIFHQPNWEFFNDVNNAQLLIIILILQNLVGGGKKVHTKNKNDM